MKNQNAICINLQMVFVPFMTAERFADYTGVSFEMVKKLRKDGKLPILDKSAGQGRVLIDMAKLAKTYPSILL